MKQAIITFLLKTLLSALTPDIIKGFIDAGLDWIEETVEKSETKIDDKLVLPICDLLRRTLNVPDDD